MNSFSFNSHEDFSWLAFIVGSGRSGTTLLYKLLSLHPETGYISSVENRLPFLPPNVSGRWRARSYAEKLEGWFDNGANAYHISRRWRDKTTPVPVEGEKIYARCGVPLFPSAEERLSCEAQRRLKEQFAGILQASGGKLFVSKRTANNRRIAMLNETFPGAKYVDLLRDGRDVAASLRKVDWWGDHLLWWDADRRSPNTAVAQGSSMVELCARDWVEGVRQVRDALELIPPENVLHVRYEEILKEPIVQIKRILQFLSLDSDASYERAINSLKLEYRPSDWSKKWLPDEYETLMDVQGEELRDAGYAS